MCRQGANLNTTDASTLYHSTTSQMASRGLESADHLHNPYTHNIPSDINLLRPLPSPQNEGTLLMSGCALRTRSMPASWPGLCVLVSDEGVFTHTDIRFYGSKGHFEIPVTPCGESSKWRCFQRSCDIQCVGLCAKEVGGRFAGPLRPEHSSQKEDWGGDRRDYLQP